MFTFDYSVGKSEARPPLSAMIGSADYLPEFFQVDRRRLTLRQTTRKSIKNAAFLLPEMLGPGQRAFRVNIDDLDAAGVGHTPASGAAHHIFISASCCSTLLARYLDLIPGCLVLREPGALPQLARLRFGPAPSRWSDTSWSAEDWRKWVAICLALLARRRAGEHAVVMKHTDLCNAMAGQMLAADVRSKAVFLSTDVRTFIFSMLRSEPRRAWLRQRVRLWRRFPKDGADLARLDPKGEAQGAAYLWAVTHWLWRVQECQAGPARLMRIDGGDVAENPSGVMMAINRFFSLGLSEREAAAVAGSGTGSVNAKRTAKAYGRHARARDLGHLAVRLGNEADRAIRWVSASADAAQAISAYEDRFALPRAVEV